MKADFISTCVAPVERACFLCGPEKHKRDCALVRSTGVLAHAPIAFMPAFHAIAVMLFLSSLDRPDEKLLLPLPTKARRRLHAFVSSPLCLTKIYLNLDF